MMRPQMKIAVLVNGRAVLVGDVRVLQPERVAERVQWAGYKFRTFGAWPGEERENKPDKRDSVRQL